MADVQGIGTDFLKQLLAKVPEASRGSVEQALLAPEAADAVKFAGEHVMTRSDYSRNMDAIDQEKARLGKWHQDLTAWWGEKKPLVDRAEAVAHNPANLADPNVDPARVTPTPTLPADLIRKEDVLKLLDEREAGAARFFAVSQDLTLRHFQEFGERLNLSELMADPRSPQIGIEAVYQAKFGDRYKDKADKAQAVAIEAKVTERVAEERKKFARSPYPVSAADTGSPLDVLDDKTKASQFSAESAADEYTDLVSKKLSGTPAPA